jgi:hypothetical protein
MALFPFGRKSVAFAVIVAVGVLGMGLRGAPVA